MIRSMITEFYSSNNIMQWVQPGPSAQETEAQKGLTDIK